MQLPSLSFGWRDDYGASEKSEKGDQLAVKWARKRCNGLGW